MARRTRTGRIVAVTPYKQENAPVGAERDELQKEQTADAKESPPELLC